MSVARAGVHASMGLPRLGPDAAGRLGAAVARAPVHGGGPAAAARAAHGVHAARRDGSRRATRLLRSFIYDDALIVPLDHAERHDDYSVRCFFGENLDVLPILLSSSKCRDTQASTCSVN